MPSAIDRLAWYQNRPFRCSPRRSRKDRPLSVFFRLADIQQDVRSINGMASIDAIESIPVHAVSVVKSICQLVWVIVDLGPLGPVDVGNGQLGHEAVSVDCSFSGC